MIPPGNQYLNQLIRQLFESAKQAIEQQLKGVKVDFTETDIVITIPKETVYEIATQQLKKMIQNADVQIVNDNIVIRYPLDILIMSMQGIQQQQPGQG